MFSCCVIKEFNQETSNGKETPAPTTDLSEEDTPTTSEEIIVVSELPVRNVIGKLWWAAGISRPDIVCALHKCASCKTNLVKSYGSTYCG